MKQLFSLAAMLLLALTALAQSPEPSGSETTLIFVRHAEKMDDGTQDPSLSEEGKARALRLAQIMMDQYKLTAIYSTPYKRTKETASPIADSLGMEIQEYGLSDPKALIQSIIDSNKGTEALIVGHSNTTPLFVNLLLGEQRFNQLDEKAYGDLFVVTVTESEAVSVQKLSY